MGVQGDITAAAIARRDGSDGDGIHLLWTPPPSAGWSVDGWDVQRRKASKEERKISCQALTAAELEALHVLLRLPRDYGELRVREADCPTFPELPPDDPAGAQPEPPKRTCTSFARLKPGRGPNPRRAGRIVLEVREATGAPAADSAVVTFGEVTGLYCGAETSIALPSAALAVELELACFAGPAEVEAFAADGTSAGAVKTSGKQKQAERVRLTGAALARVVIRAPQRETLLLEACFLARAAAKGGGALRRAGEPGQLPPVARARTVAGGSAAAAAVRGTSGRSRCLAYDVRLDEQHRFVEVRAGVPGGLAIALRDGDAVDTRMLTNATGPQVARFDDRAVDQVLLYVARPASSLEVCLDAPRDPEHEEKAWANEPFVAKGIQLPLRTLDPALSSDGDEETQAKSRLLGSESFDQAAFRDVADLMNAAAADAADVAPVWYSAAVRADLADPFAEVRVWPYALALLLDPAWRRMLGFGFLDRDPALNPGDAYDYRIVGRFRRRDVEETLHGFHGVPRGTTLPRAFGLGPALLRTPAPAVVELLPAPPDGALTATGRKGIALSGDPCLTITFAEPVARVVLEIAPGARLRWTAQTTGYLPGLPIGTFSDSVPAGPRAEIVPDDPIDTLTLSGDGVLLGLRSPVVEQPDEVVTRSVVLPGVVFEDSPLPPEPPFLGTLNLQEPAVATPASPSAPPAPPASLGFRLRWMPPAPGGAAAVAPWPLDLAAHPPFDVLSFVLERRRVDTDDSFQQLDKDLLAFGSRSGRRDPPPLSPGVQIGHAFPDDPAPTPPVPVFMSLDDALVSAKAGGPPPGSLHQYRIFSVDAIGRRSATARDGSVVRLEKRQPPPQPVGSPEPPPSGAIAPSGVRARILQAVDADLPAADRRLLGTAANAVVLEWGWTSEERERDPHATEFRVYWQPLPPDVVTGSLSGAASLAGGAWEIAASFDRPLAADAMAGRWIKAPDHAFKVLSHPAGQSTTLRLAPNPIDAQRVPAAAAIEFSPLLDGAEQRPPAWAERIAVEPIARAQSYRIVLADLLTLTAANPRTRVWVGVSAADDQSYVADALRASSPNGGRPGNESAIVAAAASARYLGRPDFRPPPPLADVPEEVTDEPAGETVAVRLELPAWLPGVAVPGGHRALLERIGLDAVAACVGATADDRIAATLPDGSRQTYRLGNASDQASFLAQIRSGTPAQVEGRFLMDALLRFQAQMEPLWQRALPQPVAFAPQTDALPHAANRHAYRIRLADPAGHLSAAGAVMQRIVRVPSMRSPGPPLLDVPSSDTDELTVTVRVRDAFDLGWVVLFTVAGDATAPLNGQLSRPAQLLRLPNRRDLYPDEGLRLRLPSGDLVAPQVALDATAGVVEAPDRVLTGTLSGSHEQRFAIWAVALTRDGIPSRFAGPTVALTGPAPLVAPALAVRRARGTDTATWPALAVPALLALERSEDAGTTWRQVSPWLAETVSTYALPEAGGARARYRVQLRADRGRRTTGPAVRAS